MNYKLAKNGVFFSIQGEGALIGLPMVFIRLAGCSIGCYGCDTNYQFKEVVNTKELVQRVAAAHTLSTEWVWITGGEPMDQDLTELISTLQPSFKVAVATSGKYQQSINADWMSVSPHYVNFSLKDGSEVKLVPGLNGFQLKDVVETDFRGFQYKFVQPLLRRGWSGEVVDKESLKQCLEWLETKTDWRLTPQAHKQWGLS